jgi:hypothetical protein
MSLRDHWRPARVTSFGGNSTGGGCRQGLLRAIKNLVQPGSGSQLVQSHHIQGETGSTVALCAVAYRYRYSDEWLIQNNSIQIARPIIMPENGFIRGFKPMRNWLTKIQKEEAINNYWGLLSSMFFVQKKALVHPSFRHWSTLCK